MEDILIKGNLFVNIGMGLLIIIKGLMVRKLEKIAQMKMRMKLRGLMSLGSGLNRKINKVEFIYF